MSQNPPQHPAAAAFELAVAGQWKELVERLPMIAVGLDRHGNVTYANPYFYSLSGFTPEQVLGEHWFERFVPEADRVDVSTAFVEILSNEFHPTYQNPIVDADGKEHLVRWFNVRLTTPDGEIAGTFSLGQVVGVRPSDQGVEGDTGTDEEIVTMCAWCSRVREEEDEGEVWQRPGAYLSDHMHVTVTHGLCPSCYEFVAEGRDRRGADVP